MQSYIGITRRKFKEIIQDHKADIKFCRRSTAMLHLNYKQTITTDFYQAKIIYQILITIHS